jgi:hypothetical protein
LDNFPIGFANSLAATSPSPRLHHQNQTGKFWHWVSSHKTSAILVVGAIVRIISLTKPRPINDPGVLNGKAVFYITGFLFEIIVVNLYAAFRIDLRFHVPDGCHAAGDYTGKAVDRRLSTDSTAELVKDDSNDIDVNKLVESYADEEKAVAAHTETTSIARTWTGKPTEVQVQSGLEVLGLNHKIFGQSVDVGDSKLLFYVFEVKQDGQPSGPGMDGYQRALPAYRSSQYPRESRYAPRASGFYGQRPPPPRQSAYGQSSNVRRMSNMYMMGRDI